MTQADAPVASRQRHAISIVVPVYNEEENLRPLVDEVLEVGLPEQFELELLLVDDASTDSSPAIIRELMARHPFITAIRHERNAGKSAAWLNGFDAARHDIIVTIDADLQNDPRDIKPMVELLVAEKLDMVSGQRRRRADTLSRKIQSRIANYTRRAVLRDNALDCGCGLKVFRRHVLKRILLFNGSHRFLEALVNMQGFKCRSLLVNDRPRLYGEAKYGLRNRAFKPFFDMLAVRWMSNRLIQVGCTPVAAASPNDTSKAPRTDDAKASNLAHSA